MNMQHPTILGHSKNQTAWTILIIRIRLYHFPTDHCFFNFT